jgi:hypothetical protein
LLYPSAFGPAGAYEISDDFFGSTGLWTSVDDSGTGTNTYDDVLGGQISVKSAAADNDYHFLKTVKAFKIAAGKTLGFTTRFSLTEASTNKANFVLGISSDASATLLGDDGAGPPSSYSGVLLFKVDGTMSVQVETSNGSAQTTEALMDFTSGNTYQASFIVDTFDAIHARVVVSVLDENTGETASATHLVDLDSQAAAAAVFGVKAGGSSAEVLKVDYVRAYQAR